MLPPRGGLRMKLPRSESLQLHYIWGGKRAEVGYWKQYGLDQLLICSRSHEYIAENSCFNDTIAGTQNIFSIHLREIHPLQLPRL